MGLQFNQLGLKDAYSDQGCCWLYELQFNQLGLKAES